MSTPKFPRRMWADYDPTSSTPVIVYPTKAEQRSNRPDLAPIPVWITPRRIKKKK